MDCLISCFPSLARYEPFSEAGKIREQSIEIVDILLNAEKSGKNLQKRLDGVVAQSTWTERLAKAVLNGLVRAIEAGEKAATAMADALRRAKDAAVDFACEHPAYTTLLALGVLVILAPWVIEALGFGELGPIEGNCAIMTHGTLLNTNICSRLVCCSMASWICRLRTEGVSFLILSAPGNDMALSCSQHTFQGDDLSFCEVTIYNHVFAIVAAEKSPN